MAQQMLGSIVAQGRTADIHAWGNGQVIKLYHAWFKLEWIQKEAHKTAVLNQLPLPMPAVGELLQVNGRNGLLFEHIDGPNMLTLLLEKGARVLELSERLAKLQFRMHQLDAQLDLQSQHDKLEGDLRRAAPLSADLKKLLLNQLHQLPKGKRICHGDFHPGNVIVTANGDFIVDWNDCSLGNPLADLARTTILFLGGITGNEAPDPEFEALVRQSHDHYLATYFKLCATDDAGREAARQEYNSWLPVIAGARLSENIKTLEPWLLSEAEKIV